MFSVCREHAANVKRWPRRTDGVALVDVPLRDDPAEQTLRSTFGFHPLAVRDSAIRNQVPKIHRKTGPSVLGALMPAARRRRACALRRTRSVHRRPLSSRVHGPLNPAVDPAAAMVEVDAVLGRLTSGKLKLTRACELSYALLTALTGRLRTYTAALVWGRCATVRHLGAHRL